MIIYSAPAGSNAIGAGKEKRLRVFGSNTTISLYRPSALGSRWLDGLRNTLLTEPQRCLNRVSVCVGMVERDGVWWFVSAYSTLWNHPTWAVHRAPDTCARHYPHEHNALTSRITRSCSFCKSAL